MSPLPKLSPAKAEQYRAEWLKAVHDLAARVRHWAGEVGWSVSEEQEEIREERIGAYHVPVLEIETPQGAVFLKPIARDVLGGDGRVDLYAWPTHYRVMLLPEASHGWRVRTDSGLNWPHPWSKETFVELAEGLIAAT